MQKLVHHLKKAPESLQATLVLGWTPLPLGNQPTNPHWCKINLLTSRRRLVCPADKNACVRLRRPTEKSTRTLRCENLQTREVPEDRVVCGSSNPTTLELYAASFRRPSRLGDPCRTRGRSSGASPFASASSARKRVTSAWRSGVTSTGRADRRADPASSLNLANLALVRHERRFGGEGSSSDPLPPPLHTVLRSTFWEGSESVQLNHFQRFGEGRGGQTKKCDPSSPLPNR